MTGELKGRKPNGSHRGDGEEEESELEGAPTGIKQFGRERRGREGFRPHGQAVREDRKDVISERT